MKYNILFAVSLLLLMLGGQNRLHAQIPSYVPAADLLGWWPFSGGSLNDLSGNGYNATAVAGPTPTADRFSLANNAYRCVNTGMSHINSDNIPFNTAGNWSLSYWMRLNTYNEARVILDINQSNNCNNAPQSGQFGGHVRFGRCATGPTVDLGDTSLLLGKWHHFVIVNSGTNVKVYRNGALLIQFTTTWPTTSLNDLVLGNCDNTTNSYDRPSDVNMDDIGLWKRALNQCEIDALYTADTAQRSCYWKVTGNNIDPSGNNIFGTLNNFDVKIVSNNTNRGTITSGGLLGWNTMTPTARLHVDVTGATPTTGIRFQGLQNSNDTTVLTIDTAGNVHRMPYKNGGSNTCGTVNLLPKTSSVTGALICSQVFDDGTSVGIGTTSGFTYSSLTGGTLGTTLPPSSGTVKFEVNGVERSLASIVTSDANYKENINNIPDAMGIIKRLDGHSFTWNNKAKTTLNADNGLHIGFIAQELLNVLPEVVITDNNGDLGVNYIEIIPLLTEAIKQQQQQIDALTKLVQLGGKPASGNDKSAQNGNYLFQNAPNPFGNETKIEYQVTNMLQSAHIMIYDLNGKELMKHMITGKGKGTLTLNGERLQSGMYLYSLVIDGKEVDTKKMVVSK